MTKTNKFIPTLTICCLLMAGCAGLYKSTVTITSVVDSAMKNWAQLSVAGKTTADIDAKVVAAHDQYRAACGVAAQALQQYKTSGQPADYLKALEAVKIAATGILDLITPYLEQTTAKTLSTNLLKANTL